MGIRSIQITEIQDTHAISTGIKVSGAGGAIYLTRTEAVDLRDEIVDFLDHHKGWEK